MLAIHLNSISASAAGFSICLRKSFQFFFSPLNIIRLYDHSFIFPGTFITWSYNSYMDNHYILSTNSERNNEQQKKLKIIIYAKFFTSFLSYSFIIPSSSSFLLNKTHMDRCRSKMNYGIFYFLFSHFILIFHSLYVVVVVVSFTRCWWNDK